MAETSRPGLLTFFNTYWAVVYVQKGMQSNIMKIAVLQATAQLPGERQVIKSQEQASRETVANLEEAAALNKALAQACAFSPLPRTCVRLADLPAIYFCVARLWTKSLAQAVPSSLLPTCKVG